MPVDILPTDIGVKGRSWWKNYAVECYWDVEEHFKAHESKEAIASGREIEIGWEYGVELGIEGNVKIAEKSPMILGGKKMMGYSSQEKKMGWAQP